MNIRSLKLKTTLLLIFSLIWPCHHLYADSLQLVNGDRLTGTLKGIAGELVEFETDYAGTLRIKQEHVAAIESDQQFTLIQDDGTRAESTLDANMDLASLDIARTDVGFGLGQFLGLVHTIDLSASYSLGNSTTQVYLLNTASELTRPSSEHILKTAIHRDTAEGELLKNQYHLNYKTRHFMGEKWFYALNADGFRDPLKSIDLRLSPTVGIGHRFWDHTYGNLTVEVGVAGIYETFDELSEKYPAVSWELDFSRRLLGGRLEAFHQHRLLSAVTDGVVLDSSNGLRYALVDNLNLNLLANLKHDTEVAEGVEKTDITYVAGIGISF